MLLLLADTLSHAMLFADLHPEATVQTHNTVELMCNDGAGWRFMEPAGYTGLRVAVVNNRNDAWGGLDSHTGGQYVGLHGAGAFVEQLVHGLDVGHVYTVSFRAARRPTSEGRQTSGHELILTVDGIEVWRYSSLTDEAFEEFSTTFTSRRSSCVVRFENSSPDSHNDILLDGLQMAACLDCPVAQAFGAGDFIESCSASSDLYITFLGDALDRSWTASTELRRFNVRLCVGSQATILFQGNTLSVDSHDIADDCPDELRANVLIDGSNNLETKQCDGPCILPSYTFPTGSFEVPAPCERVDVEKLVTVGSGMVNVVAPSAKNQWTGVVEVVDNFPTGSVYDITVVATCGRTTRDIVVHGRPSLVTTGITFDGAADYVTISSWGYAQDAVFSVSCKLAVISLSYCVKRLSPCNAFD
eukprot:COSAG02_NODE_145_length_34010_cov_7.359696_3_plen_416_part_00